KPDRPAVALLQQIAAPERQCSAPARRYFETFGRQQWIADLPQSTAVAASATALTVGAVALFVAAARSTHREAPAPLWRSRRVALPWTLFLELFATLRHWLKESKLQTEVAVSLSLSPLSLGC